MLLWPPDMCDRWERQQEIGSAVSKGRRPQQLGRWHRWTVHSAPRKEGEDRPENMRRNVRFLIWNRLVEVALILSGCSETACKFLLHDLVARKTKILHSLRIFSCFYKARAQYVFVCLNGLFLLCSVTIHLLCQRSLTDTFGRFKSKHRFGVFNFCMMAFHYFHSTFWKLFWEKVNTLKK